MFEVDEQILSFLHSIQEFEKIAPNERDSDSITEICANKTPVGLVPLETTFDRDDAFKGRTETTTPEEYQEINVGTVADPKMIRLVQVQLKKRRRR